MILIVAWHVMPVSLLVLATVLIGGGGAWASTKDPGTACVTLCKLWNSLETQFLHLEADLHSPYLPKPP